MSTSRVDVNINYDESIELTYYKQLIIDKSHRQVLQLTLVQPKNHRTFGAVSVNSVKLKTGNIKFPRKNPIAH